jgi:hypothetical protein
MPTNFSAASLPVTRRRPLTLPATAAAAPRRQPESASATCAPRRLVDDSLTEPVGHAYHYLDVVQDAYVTGGEPRLLQSYNNESGLMTAGFVYDNALATLAYLANPTVANVRRARLIGDALLWIQANDEKYTDGRVRQAYAAGPMLFYGGGPDLPGLRRDDGKAAFLWPFGFGGSSVGDIAWTGLALAQLYADTRIGKYLDGAVALAEWITTKQSPFRYGGYHGGLAADGETPQPWVSTEHNIDAYALFMLLRTLTRARLWAAHAEVAAAFVRKMWNETDHFFWTGTLAEDPDSINTGNIPEDVQTWSLLGVGDRQYDDAVDWVTANLANTDGGPGSQLPAGVTVTGVTYSSQAKTLTGTAAGGDEPNDRNAVWLEGNGHTALALLQRDRPGDAAYARRLLRQTVGAQEQVGAGQTVGRTVDPAGGRLSNPAEGGTWTGAPLSARSGIVAASSALDTGFAFSYFQRQHVGATSWFLMAAQNFNPYR